MDKTELQIFNEHNGEKFWFCISIKVFTHDIISIFSISVEMPKITKNGFFLSLIMQLSIIQGSGKKRREEQQRENLQKK